MKQIYIADDNHELAALLGSVAFAEGWAVETCGNGVDLVAKLKNGNGPALALIDVNMPEQDGIETIDGLLETGRDLRIRFMTGGAVEAITAAQMIAKARSLRVGRSIYKPFSKQDMINLLKEEESELQGSGETS